MKKATVKILLVLFLFTISFYHLIVHIHADVVQCDNCGNNISYNPDEIICEGARLPCEKCGFTVFVTGNKHNYFVDQRQSREATCTSGGRLVELCAICQRYKETIIPSKNHNWVVTANKDATCTSDGVSQQKCSSCNQTRDVIIPKLNHSFKETILKKVSCEENGLIRKTCTRCNETNDVKVKALGHKFSKWTTKKEVTCTKDGEEIRTCSRCNKVESNTIEALGHDIDEFEISKEASCIENGLKKVVCKRCNEEINEEIPALGHDYDEFKIVKEASLFSKGRQEKTCQRCGDIVSEDIKALSLKEYQKEHPAIVITAAGGSIAVVGAGIYIYLSKKAAQKVAKVGVKVVGKSVTAKTAKELLGELEIKTIDLIATENEHSKSLMDILKKAPMIVFNFDGYKDYLEKLEENEPDMIIYELNDDISLNEIKELTGGLEDSKLLIIGLEKIINKYLDTLETLKEDNLIIVYTNYDKFALTTTDILLPLYKPDLDVDNSLDGLSLILSVFGLDWASEALDLISSGKEIYDIVKEGDSDAVDKLTVLAEALGMFGIDAADTLEDIASYIEKINQGIRKTQENLNVTNDATNNNQE